ncbi:MAG: hypothetical protein AAF434_00805 [Pseudomonadota bacterium]
MPHCEIKYSDNLSFDAEDMLSMVEAIINEHDSNAHECKGRAYPTSIYHRPHLKVTVSLLPKPHRDDSFTKKLMDDLEMRVKEKLSQSCYFSLLVEYSSNFYVTNEHVVVGDNLPRYTDG